MYFSRKDTFNDDSIRNLNIRCGCLFYFRHANPGSVSAATAAVYRRLPWVVLVHGRADHDRKALYATRAGQALVCAGHGGAETYTCPNRDDVEHAGLLGDLPDGLVQSVGMAKRDSTSVMASSNRGRRSLRNSARVHIRNFKRFTGVYWKV